MVGIVIRMRSAIHWMKAVNLSSKKEYESALIHVAFVENVTETAFAGGPSKYNIYSGILKAYIFYQTGRFRETIDVLTVTRMKMKMSQVRQLSEEKKYLDNYMSTLYKESVIKLASYNHNEIPQEFKIIHNDLNLNNVPKHIRQLFPMKWP